LRDYSKTSVPNNQFFPAEGLTTSPRSNPIPDGMRSFRDDALARNQRARTSAVQMGGGMLKYTLNGGLNGKTHCKIWAETRSFLAKII
jgi:hypothetical protein